jgi:hypothetical protein
LGPGCPFLTNFLLEHIGNETDNQYKSPNIPTSYQSNLKSKKVDLFASDCSPQQVLMHCHPNLSNDFLLSLNPNRSSEVPGECAFPEARESLRQEINPFTYPSLSIHLTKSS